MDSVEAIQLGLAWIGIIAGAIYMGVKQYKAHKQIVRDAELIEAHRIKK